MKVFILALCLAALTAMPALAAPQARLTVSAYVDFNGNGMQDANDPPKAGIVWVASSGGTTYRCYTNSEGFCGWELSPGNWQLSAYHDFVMLVSTSVQLGADDATVSTAVEPRNVYLPIFTK